MDHNNTEQLRDPGGDPAWQTDWEASESFCPEKEQRRLTPCSINEDLNTDGFWSQSSISRSLQRAEMLLRSTFNPGLRWLFHVRSQDEEEEEEEGNFVLAHNLVSRSSARLLRLQHALLTVAPQWLPVGRAGSTQVCVRGPPVETVLLLPPSSPSLHKVYLSLRRLQEQRSLLLFIHEFSRRARLAAAFISRVTHMLERAHLMLSQTRSSWPSLRVDLVSLSQELRAHVNHWSCLFSKVQSDQNLRLAVVRHTWMLQEVHQSLDLLSLQALVLMEQFVFLVLGAVARSDMDSVPREVLEDLLAGTELYNQTVGEQRAYHSATQLRTAILQQAQHQALGPGLPCSRGCHPAGVTVRELMAVFAEHHAQQVAQQLHTLTSDLHHTCQVHRILEGPDPSAGQGVHCGTRTLGSEWTWDQLQHTYITASITHQSPLQPCAPPTSPQKNHPGHIPDFDLDRENHRSGSKTTPVQHTSEHPDKDQTSQCQVPSQTGPVQTLISETQSSLETSLPQSGPLSGALQDRVSVELLLQLLVCSGELLSPLTSQTRERLKPNTGPGKTSPLKGTARVLNPESGETDGAREELNQDQHVELEFRSATETINSSGNQLDADPERWAESASENPLYLRWSPSVQWMDLGQSVLFAEVMAQYRPLLVTLCSRALWLQLTAPPTPNSAESINLQDPLRRTRILHRVKQAAGTELLPQEFTDMLQDLSLYLLNSTAHAQWDHEVCRALGSTLKDKCLTGVKHQLSTENGSGVMMSSTMEHFLHLPPPLLSSLSSSQSNSRTSGPLSLPLSGLSLRRHTISLALATVQLSTGWVMSKSLQFLSSWSLIKFLLITQGDLKVLMASIASMLHHTQSLLMKTPESQSAPYQHHHHRQLLRKQLSVLDGTVSSLQMFSGVVLKTFSRDCKMISGEIFEQTMPAAVHWRPNLRTGFPSNPSEYASVAAQTVIGQVIEGMAPMSDDARAQALSITMTAFMEAWMEHILRHKIRFSVQGALQLKQDFDSIREMIQSEKYGLSADLHHKLLSLRVFQQVDSAVVCLLQQPQAKPYLQSRAWEPFTHCCPAHSSTDIDSVVGSSSITNLRCLEGEELTDPSLVASDLPPVDPSAPGEPYLAPSAVLGSAQQDWLDLRIQNTARRWRLPGLHCLSKSEP